MSAAAEPPEQPAPALIPIPVVVAFLRFATERERGDGDAADLAERLTDYGSYAQRAAKMLASFGASAGAALMRGLADACDAEAGRTGQ